MNSLPLFPDFALGHGTQGEPAARVVRSETPKRNSPYRDVTASRHKGNQQSREANKKVAPYKASMRERIRVWIAARGWDGSTLKEICQGFDKVPNEISGRLSELKAEEVIFNSGRRRDGCAVLVSEKRWADRG